MKLFDEFIREYDDGTLKFNDIQYRAGARFTSMFGLVKGYRKAKNRFIWDTIRVHVGTDRSGIFNSRGDRIKNVVISPFNFNRSELNDYGDNHVYGSLIRLFNDKYRFELRIAHMHPEKNIDKEVLKLLKNKLPISRNTVLGSAGSYGLSDGDHTHTELVSMDIRCEVIEEILVRKYGEKIKEEIPTGEILKTYNDAPFWKNKTAHDVLGNYNHLKEQRNIVGIFNPYKMEYKDWFSGNQVRTRYSSLHAFNGV